MKNSAKQNSIFDLFKIIELTRAQSQYGYILGGTKRWQLSNLAEHHYLVTFIAWQLTELIKAQGGKIDQMKVMELSMVHDLGEIFGGDIGMPYARRNPKAKELARKFEEENAFFLSQYFLGSENKFKDLWREATDANSDEGYITKIADLVECFAFKFYMNDLTKVDMVLAKERLPKTVAKIKDKNSRKAMEKVIKSFFKDFSKKNVRSIISGINE